MQKVQRIFESGIGRSTGRKKMVPPRLGHLQAQRQYQGNLLEFEQYPSEYFYDR